MFSSSRDDSLKLSKTTSPQKLFPSDCSTLYVLSSNIFIKVHYLRRKKEKKKKTESSAQPKNLVECQ